jgi:hypothetical protein
MVTPLELNPKAKEAQHEHKQIFPYGRLGRIRRLRGQRNGSRWHLGHHRR